MNGVEGLMLTDFLRVGHISEHSTIYGPGLRFVIWTQGCTLACEGCWNKQYWPHRGGTNFSVQDLVNRISKTPSIEGITLLGGEPLQQPWPIFKLISEVKKMGKTVFLYTGYNVEEFDDLMQACFDICDIVVTGRFEQGLRNTNLRWRGSENQKIHFPTRHYNLGSLEDRNEIEFVINDNGTLEMYGYPSEEISSWIENV